MRSCVYCKRRYKKNSEISFHRFPKDFQERKTWLQNMKTINWSPKKYDSLCSLHFADECFNKHFNRTVLKPCTIPTKFEGTSAFSLSPLQSTASSAPRPSTSSPCMSTSTSLPTSSTSSTRTASVLIHTAKRKKNCDENITHLTDKSNEDKEQITGNDYVIFSTPKMTRIEFGLLHDHRYEITPRSSKKDAQQTIKSSKLSKAKSNVLSQCVKRLKLKVANLKSALND